MPCNAVLRTEVLHVQDDPFGAPFPLCESDFSGPDSRDSLVRWLAETQFDATLFCPDCQAAPPPPPPVEALPQAPQALAVRLLKTRGASFHEC